MEESCDSEDFLRQPPINRASTGLDFTEDVFTKYFSDAPKEEYNEIHRLLCQVPPLARTHFKDFMSLIRPCQVSFMARLILVFKMSSFFVEIQAYHNEEKQCLHKSGFNKESCAYAFLPEQWRYRILCAQLRKKIYLSPESLKTIETLGALLDKLKPSS